MGRRIFFVLHFALGFLLLWLLNQLIHYDALPKVGAPLWLEAALETAYLVTGVIWGNIGWDTFKSIPDDAQFSLMVYVLSRTLAPVSIALPVFLVLLSPFYQGRYLSWRLAVTWENGVLLALAAIVLIIQLAYKRSEKGFFYKAWRA